jgi:alpha-2-macroglobulin
MKMAVPIRSHARDGRSGEGSSRRARLAAAFVLFALATLCSVTPVFAQDQPESTEPSFSVSSRQTYAPSQEPKIWLTFKQVDHLDFRVYRVKDPVLFFSKLKDAHSFGSEKEELAQEKTWLERFHDWKRDLRASIRDFFRSQLRFETRYQMHSSRVQKQKMQRIPLDVTSYAQMPLLNREQLTLGWREVLPKTRDSEYQEIPVDVHDKGLYLVAVAYHELRAYTLVMVTDLALVSKTAPGQVLLFVAKRDSGTPVAGASAVVFNNHEELGRGVTDASGVFQTTFNQIKVDNSIMVATAGNDVAATSVEPFFFFDTSATEYVGYIYTDRPVYRPTHEVDFKGILRAKVGGRYSLDIPGPITVEIIDSNQKTIYQQKLALSSFGSFNGKLTLAPLAALGTYGITAHIGDKNVYGSFEVQEYKKPEYEVTVSTDKSRYLEGEPIQATITGRYYFGAPVSGGSVKYSIYRSGYEFPYWRILWGDDAEEGDDSEGGENSDYFGQEIKQGTGQLDQDGVLHVTLPTEVDDKRNDYSYRIEAHVTDASNREIVGGHSVNVTYSTLALIVETDRYVYAPGQMADVIVHTLDYDSNPVSATVTLNFGAHPAWGSNAQAEPLSEASVTTDAHGITHYSYKIPEKHWLEVEAVSTDANQREARFSTSLWIATLEGATDETEARPIDIYPDKHSYKPGDIAHVLIASHSPGAQVLVTTEGQQVYTWSVHQVAGDAMVVDVPIEQRFESNFFLAATFVKNEQLMEGSKNISVPATEKVLKVTVATDKPEYRPGEKVTYTLTAQDSKGHPVSAELSLGVVDEAIYAVRPESSEPPEKTFYAREWDQVFTQFSTNYWFMGYSGDHKMELTQLRAPTRLADFKNPQTVQPQVRKYFPDTIQWQPTLTTDASGKARTSFDFPDSLTTWRATVRAVTRDTMVGQVVSKVITTKKLILRLELPRFMDQGDTATLTGIVHNYLATDKMAKVSLDAQGVDLASPAETTVNVPKNGEAVVTWNVRAAKIAQAKFVAKALTDEESDALELEMPVEPWGLQQNVAQSGALRESQNDIKRSLVFPQDLNADASTLRIDLAPSIAGTMMSALDFLASYPYGCVEQTMSSFLPNILVTKAIKDLGLTPPAASTELDKKIGAGLQRLYMFQHDDGGWGWWQTDETHPFMTAYVVAGLAQAKDAGYPIDEERLKKGRDSLLKQIKENPRAVADIRAYMIYTMALSGDVDRDLVDDLYSSRDKLSPHGQALMALLLMHEKDGRAQEFVKLLEANAHVDGPFVSWKSEREEMLDFSEDNSFETTAYALKALANLDPKSDLLPRAARWLMEHRTDGYYWDSTEQTATAIYGLIDYLKISGELKPDYSLTVYLNGQKLADRRITEKDVANPLPIVLTAAAPQVHGGANEVRIVKSGVGVLYWSASASYFSREPKPAPAGSYALNVVREYFKLVPERQDNRIVYSEQPLIGPVAPGDVVEVRLTVNATHDEQYLQIEDPIPAGFDFIEQEGLYELKTKPSWWDFYYTQREFHDDRAALFSTTFSRGQGQFHYLLKAVTPGTFQANPARVLPMYEPARQASSGAVNITVQGH